MEYIHRMSLHVSNSPVPSMFNWCGQNKVLFEERIAYGSDSMASVEKFKLKCYDIGGESPGGAILVHTETNPHLWIPMSQVHEIHRDNEHSYVIITSWFAKKKGLR